MTMSQHETDMAVWEKEKLAIIAKHKGNEDAKFQALTLHGKSKPTEKPVAIMISKHLVVKFPKVKQTKDSKTLADKLSGGNVNICNIDPVTGKNYQAIYQPITGFAYFLDALHNSGMNDKLYTELKQATINHLPFTKHGKGSVADKDVKLLADNSPYTIKDLVNWS
jgi:hypothetical protein